jgi:UDP-N-acetylmuramoyl-tripeptide--D-alanyl-D-alanine ligase
MIVTTACLFAVAAAMAGGTRWLRIAQREHYIAGSVTRFAFRWWASRRFNIVLLVMVLVAMAAGLSGFWEGSIAAAVISLAAPVGLSHRGRSAKLTWTRRLRTVAATSAVLVVALMAAAALAGALPQVSAAVVVLMPLFTDVALAVTAPVERRLGRRFVRAATDKLKQVGPRVIAITGSYGKTSTKLYVGHLLREKYVTQTSPASFNNTAGLSRAINERLAAGTEVFVAEMGTYGRGEIRSMCSWVRPEISVITAIGPVHLERMRALDNIAAAKSEILEAAQVAVLNTDDPRLAAIGEQFRANGGKLIRCSTTDTTADVCVASDGSSVSVNGRALGGAEILGAFPANLACAVGVAVAMDIPESDIAERLATLPRPPHRQTIQQSETGVLVIDDTYNSNPQGCAGAISTLASIGDGHRKVIVTPGMVELGSTQSPANMEFARRAAAAATDLLIIGRTNRRSLLLGARDGAAAVRAFEHREDAVTWIRANLRAGDAVLYENDLPDHYP